MEGSDWKSQAMKICFPTNNDVCKRKSRFDIVKNTTLCMGKLFSPSLNQYKRIERYEKFPQLRRGKSLSQQQVNNFTLRVFDHKVSIRNLLTHYLVEAYLCNKQGWDEKTQPEKKHPKKPTWRNPASTGFFTFFRVLYLFFRFVYLFFGFFSFTFFRII